MRLEETLDKLHSKTVRIRLLQMFTALTRVLLAVGFIPPSIPKIRGIPFTQLPTSNPVGHYFDALLQTGFYYNFIGWSQIIAAILLLIPRTSHIGALMFLPIIVNIAVLTTSVGFAGTWMITILMSTACLYLVCWDYPRWKSILFSHSTAPAGFPALPLLMIPPIVGIAASLLFSVLSAMTGENTAFGLRSVLVVFTVGFTFGIIAAIHLKFMVINVGEERAQNS